MKMQMDKCPRLSYLKERISHTQKEVEELNNLIRLGGEEVAKDISDFAKCEIRIKILRAKKNLPNLYVDIERTEADFKKWKAHIQKFMDEANIDYDKVIDSARKVILSDEKIKSIFEEYKPYDLEKNYEAKVMFYANLKDAMNPDKTKVTEPKK